MANAAHRNDLVIAWLNDAHALETAIIESLEGQVDLASDHPEVQAGIQRHLEATRHHAEVVASCLAQFDEKPSAGKKVLAQIGGKLQGVAMGAAKDDLVKAALQDYATEHMEIASYRALIEAANAIGMPTIGESLKEVLADEVAMAAWLEKNTPALVREAVAHGET
ncbi:MAG: YciE/YciF ferroxidase family protein [Thermomicrobiales bacterium]